MSITKPIADTYKEQILLVDQNKPVFCYRNLHRNCWSVRQGIVRFHCDIILLTDVEFVVREKGRERTRLLQRKEVHAFVKGYLKKVKLDEIALDSFRSVYYNPYTTETFVSGTTPVLTSDYALLLKRNKMQVFKGDKKMR